MEDFRQALLTAAKQAQNVVITSHLGPDDDSVSSVLATKYFLERHADASARIVYEGSRPRRWEGFSGYEQLSFVEDLNDALSGADVVVFLDGNELSRFSDQELSLDAQTFCIDHHPCEEHPFDSAVILDGRTSTAEILYDLLYERSVDEAAAKYLLLGILGDTSNFRYVDETKARVFCVARELVEAGGIDIEAFQRSYGTTGREEFEMFAKLMGNVEIVEEDEWPAYAYSLLSEEETAGYADNDVSGGAHMFVSWMKRVEGVGWGFVLTPRSSGRTACSWRSVGVNVRHIAEGLDVGGGHDRAAGARFDVSPTEALAMIQEFVAEHEPEMT